ncbi:MAG: FAD-binding protein [Bacteroidales bacterium]|nr:FAD-binding protein [Bacteroidales bacterium]
MIKNIKIRVRPEVWCDAQKLESELAQQNAISPKSLRGYRILHSSIDARQRQVMIQLDLDVYINEEPPQTLFEPKEYREVKGDRQAVVVGLGPGGLFAALKLIELGIRPIVIERGRNVSDRRRDVAQITRRQEVDPESNFCFGEGGAGAFSDGKLFTRSKKRGNVSGVLERLCQFGADTGILDAAHPHIGTDRLPAVIANIRNEILRCGGEIHYETVVNRLLLKGSQVVGVGTNRGEEFLGPVILATGHSARDVYRMLYSEHIPIEKKGLAMGVRLEHPQQLIDQIQYHNKAGRGPYLPAAAYSFVAQCNQRGVYSFCMCPGGVVVPSATGPQQVVVNGMSASARASRWANAAMVVEIRPEDMGELLSEGICEELPTCTFLDAMGETLTADSPLVAMALQENIERNSWLNGGQKQVAPAQRMLDFVKGRLSADLPATSYTPGVLASPLHFWLPRFISTRLRSGFDVFGHSAHGFLTNDAVLIAAETRTSSPVRIPRDRDSLCHPVIAGLYPCGEGAGFAGGIVSAAMDGERCAEALASQCSCRE